MPGDLADEITGWDQGMAYVEALLALLVADRTAAARDIRATAEGTAAEQARAQALDHVVHAAVRAALVADVARAEARLELADRAHDVLPLRAVATDVLDQLDAALARVRAHQDDLGRLLSGEGAP